MNKHIIKLLILISSIALLDQCTKLTISKFFLENTYEITSFFNIVHVYNYGISYGFLNSQLPYMQLFLIIITIAIIAFIAIWFWREPTYLRGWAIGIIIGGAIGNLIDRIKLGAVMDFLDFHLNKYHFPAFNIADSAVTIGAILLIYDELLKK